VRPAVKPSAARGRPLPRRSADVPARAELPDTAGPSRGPGLVQLARRPAPIPGQRLPCLGQVAFTGRTSTLTLQDPAASLRRQARECQAKLPPGWYIAAWFWDIESGDLPTDQRGHGPGAIRKQDGSRFG
jgi:hypothetical protein